MTPTGAAALSPEDNPDDQPPLPLAPAVDYARAVMAWAREALPRDVVETLGQPYGAHRLQCMDVYAPLGARAAPVLVFWHGGGWTHGYREWVRFMAPRVTSLGLVMMAPSYRLAPQEPLPAALEDAHAALSFVERHAESWGGSAAKIYLSGHSAGGHLAAMVALTRSLHDASDSIRACLPISGIMDLHATDPAPGSLEERVYTRVLRGLDPVQDVVLSPLYWTAGARIPFELTVGEHDSARVRRSNQQLHAMLQAQGVPVALHELAGLDHFQTHLGLRDAGHPWYARLAALIRSPE